MKSKREIEIDLAKKWIELNDVKVGDKLKVISEYSDAVQGFVREMRGNIGEVFTVKAITDKGGIALEGNDWMWYYGNLEKVESKTVQWCINSWNFVDRVQKSDSIRVQIDDKGAVIDDCKYTLQELKNLVKAFELVPEHSMITLYRGNKFIYLSNVDIRTLDQALKQLQ